ncbi:uncharacterized protein LOC143224095 [Tachypleus tridentatus]|uniref:uncharacterized protein LOC143224095 n=1 Tax=Tachypleus tridentatus TaxID=6853 RepID=UPI003FCF74EF
MASRSCKYSPDAFCYACGQFIEIRMKKYSVTASAKTREAYKAYLGMPVEDQDKQTLGTSFYLIVQKGKMGRASVTMYQVCAKQLELPVTQTSGASSLIAHPEASKLCCSITRISIRLFLCLICCSSKRSTTASRDC